ncbi:hypothetical protein SEA_ARGAN_84 [Arthrobacter phage Argan]|nr:hypothetical protein SEA_ARGAN_84 [Arthrobacter phage Argan]
MKVTCELCGTERDITEIVMYQGQVALCNDVLECDEAVLRKETSES